MRKLPRKFYLRPTIDVAIDLLGCQLISLKGGVKTGGMIVEVEAYIGEDDPASHAFRGPTNRNRVMYGQAGFLYVYFTYGNHFMLNVVTEQKGFPAAVLLRGLEPLFSIETMAARRKTSVQTNIASGPGKLARALSVTGADNGADLCGNLIFIKGPAAKQRVLVSSRIGIGDNGSDRLWRFFIKDNPHVSVSGPQIRRQCLDLPAARKLGLSIPSGTG